MSTQNEHLPEVRLPSSFQPQDNAIFDFNKAGIQAKILAVRFSNYKVKYDLEIYETPEDGKNEYLSTRIYNVDSVFVIPK